MKINTITPDKHKFLKGLDDMVNPAKMLYALGSLPEDRIPAVAIVGTRKPTAYGKEVAHRLAYELAKQGVVVVSGLALGIDAVAHRAALEAGGTTIAVLANGLPGIYPATHKELARDIIANGGAILTEYAPETSARGFQFLERNRIVSGISDAVVVVEAAARSGTLNTAAHALEQGKEIFAVPGNITSPLSSGCNSLLKQGARVVTQPDDILEIIAPNLLQTQAALPLGTSPLETKILNLIQTGIRDGDELQQQSGVDAAKFSQAITMMELTGAIRALGANQWSIR